VGWGEELHPTPKKLKNNIFLAVYWDGNTAIYHKAYTGNKEILEGLLGVSKAKQIIPDDLRKYRLPSDTLRQHVAVLIYWKGNGCGLGNCSEIHTCLI
jgi:hypothetical protein